MCYSSFPPSSTPLVMVICGYVEHVTDSSIMVFSAQAKANNLTLSDVPPEIACTGSEVDLFEVTIHEVGSIASG